MKPAIRVLLSFVLAAAVFGCDRSEPEATPEADPGAAEESDAPSVKADKGVDLDKKVIRVGTLNDESGPAAAIGRPFAVGKRILAEQINAGGSGLLPEGWKIELVERDHGYNPQKSVQSYNEIKDDVLVIGTSFGTPNTMPLRPMLERDNLVALPASLSSQMAQNKYTPPVGPAYYYEAIRAMKWAVEDAGSADNVKAAIVYQQDDYGLDGLHGWRAAAEKHGITIVSEQTVQPGQQDYAAVVTTLKDAGANYVMLSVLPTGTGPILGTSLQLQYQPKWIGNIASWTDRFFDAEVIPPQVLTNYHIASGLPYWGEEVEGMQGFTQAFEKFGKGANKDMYILLSYIQGLIVVEAASRAIEAGDISREGFLAQLHTIDNFDAGGLIQPMSFTEVPYVVSTRTRIVKPDLESGSWTVVSDFKDADEYDLPNIQ